MHKKHVNMAEVIDSLSDLNESFDLETVFLALCLLVRDAVEDRKDQAKVMSYYIDLAAQARASIRGG